MKKWFVLICLTAFWLSVRVPFEKRDVAQLSPVSAVSLFRKGGKLCVASDRGDVGFGDTLEEALEDMELTCPSVIFLDTVEYLLIGPDSVEYEELTAYFRPGVGVVSCGPDTDPAEAADYLRNRKGSVTLRDVEMGEKEVPFIYTVDGRYYLNGETGEFDTAFCVDSSSDIGAVGDCRAGERMGDESDCGPAWGSTGGMDR